MPPTPRGSTSETSPSPDRLTTGSFTMNVLIGMLVAKQFKLTPIQAAATGIASVCGSGVAMPDPEGGFHLQDTGLVINSGLTAAIAVALLLLIGEKLGNYTILLLSTIVTLVAGGVGGAVGISGTPISAGFGISGLVGPLAALNYEGWGWTAGNLAIIAMVFIALPLVMSILFNFLFSRIGLVRSEHYKLDFK